VVAASDCLITQSAYSRAELLRYAARQGWPLPSVELIRFGAGFRVRSAPERRSAASLPPRPVLFVSSIHLRKNHALLVAIWRRLVAKHGAAYVPSLVFVGRLDWPRPKLMAELAADRFLDGKIVVLPRLSDAELRDAYRDCRFTVFPSLYEGWGLPIAESLAYGKFCVSANRTALPEVGGDFVDYFDPDDEDDALAKIERVLFEPGYLDAREARLRAEYRAPSWADCMDQLLATLGRVAVASQR
jgi:glycosyltransferase involved in cell wall biosynthesis